MPPNRKVLGRGHRKSAVFEPTVCVYHRCSFEHCFGCLDGFDGSKSCVELAVESFYEAGDVGVILRRDVVSFPSIYH